MTRDEVIRTARDAGFRTGNITLSSGDPLPFVAPLSATTCIVELERFAALIEAAATEKANELADQRVVAEHEACAKVCEEQERGAGDAMTFYTATGQCAAAIRNRKDTTK